MRKSRILLLSGAIVLGTGLPAIAAFDHIGTIDVGFGQVQGRTFGEFGGPVERLSFEADRGTVNCQSIRIALKDGSVSEIFSGELKDDFAHTIELPDDKRDLTSIEFECAGTGDAPAFVDISAELGTYREVWLRDQTWSTRWPQSSDVQWISLGQERFSGADDEETETAELTAPVSSIGLRPIDADAQCSQVSAEFEDGTHQNLAIRADDRLSENQIYQIDLPAPGRVTSVEMQCTAMGDNDVTIEVYAAG